MAAGIKALRGRSLHDGPSTTPSAAAGQLLQLAVLLVAREARALLHPVVRGVVRCFYSAVLADLLIVRSTRAANTVLQRQEPCAAAADADAAGAACKWLDG